MSSADLPELVRIDLNPDGSVTLLLTRSSQKLARIDFGPSHLNPVYMLRELSMTLPYEGNPETLGFRFDDDAGASFFLEAYIQGALEWGGRILEHLKTPHPKPAAS